MQDEYDFITVNGTPRYRKNRKLVNKNSLPRDVMERFGLLNSEPHDEASQANESVHDSKSCIFCGAHSRFIRFINLQTVYLCDDHYYNVNAGKIVQRLREVKEAENAAS